MTLTENDSNPSALKHLFGKSLLKRMANSLAEVYPSFDRKRFLGKFSEMEKLEMKPRVLLLRDELKHQLPKNYREALRILLTSAEKGELGGFDLWPYSQFIQTYGLEDLKTSLEALKRLTPRFTSEFAIRPYLIRYPNETMKFLEKCAKSSNVDVRRWASEGSRPRLPWGERLQEFVKDPSPTAKILECLKFDEELYVRKSVSNHLNDMTKDHPEKVIRLLARWKKEAGKKHGEKIDWIIHRALRSLIKAGHPGALKLIGVSMDTKVKIDDFRLNQRSFRLGERMEFTFTLRSLNKTSQKVVIDYVLHFMKANGKTAPKVFKLKSLEMSSASEVIVQKSHHLKPITTRVHYAGVHRLEIQVNGQIVHHTDWKLILT